MQTDAAMIRQLGFNSKHTFYLRQTKKDILLYSNLANEKFESITYDNLNITSRRVKKCQFEHVNFKNCSLGSETIFRKCIFINCNFSGRYSSFGTKTKFIDCIFQDCVIKGNTILWGSNFQNCTLSGTLSNVILRNEKSLFLKSYKFKNCDLRHLMFNNVAFNGNRFFKNCKMPNESLRIFKNDNDELIDKVLDLTSKNDSNGLRIIFDKTLRTKFNPFIIDKPFIQEFLNQDELVLFESLVAEYEITQNEIII